MTAIWDWIKENYAVAIMVPIVATLIGGLLLHFIIIPLIHKVMNRISEKSRIKSAGRTKEIYKKALELDNMFKIIDYRIERNGLQGKAILNLILAVLFSISVHVQVYGTGIINKWQMIFALFQVVLILWFGISGALNAIKAGKMDVVLSCLERQAGSDQNVNSKPDKNE